MRCCNCGGEHSAAFGGFAVQIKAKEVQKYKIINNVSYAEALKKVNDETQRTVTYEDMGRGEEDSERPRPLPQRASRTRIQQEDRRDPIIQQKPCSHKCNAKEDSLVVDKASFIAFICKVINVAIRKEKKSDRIKSVVDAAEEFLDIKDLKAEEIQKIAGSTF